MSTVSATRPTDTTEPRKVIPLRRPGRIAAAIIILVLLAQGILILFTNPNFEWEVVAGYLFAPPIMQGLWLTLWLTAPSAPVESAMFSEVFTFAWLLMIS